MQWGYLLTLNHKKIRIDQVIVLIVFLVSCVSDDHDILLFFRKLTRSDLAQNLTESLSIVLIVQETMILCCEINFRNYAMSLKTKLKTPSWSWKLPIRIRLFVL